MLDNVVRAWVLKTDTKLHPLLAFVSVLGGIQTLGLWGVFVGPIVASCLYALIRIFNTELTALSQERQAISTEAASPAPLASPVVAMEAPLSPGPAHEAK
jgi:predicted PurR-regulated permease PerM